MSAPTFEILGERLTFGDWDNGVWVVAVLVMVYGFTHTWAWRRRRRAKLDAIGPLTQMFDARDRYVGRAVLVVSAAALLVLALMRPQLGMRETEVKNRGIDIAIAIDASKSMRVSDVLPDRLAAAKLEINRMLGNLTGGRVTLVPFAGLAFIQTPLTSDFQVVSNYLADLRVEDMPRGGTAIGFAVHEALRALLPADALEGTPAEVAGGAQKKKEDTKGDKGVEVFEGSKHKAIILFTDGEDHETQPKEAAALCKKLGVTLFTVGVGTPQGRPVPMLNDKGEDMGGGLTGPDGKKLFSELNEVLLQDMAEMTGGDYFHLSARGLGNGLLSSMDRLEKKEFEATFKQLGADRYQWVLIPAILLLLLEGLWASRRRSLRALQASRRSDTGGRRSVAPTKSKRPRSAA